MSLKNPTPEEIKKAVADNLGMFENRLVRARNGEPGFRERELVNLVALWRGIEAADGDYRALSQGERDELRDALIDEGVES